VNNDPYIFAKINIQINGGVIMEAFNSISNFMGDLIKKAWNLLGENAKKQIQRVFNFVGDVVAAVKQMADGIIRRCKGCRKSS
jgi:phage-related protein